MKKVLKDNSFKIVCSMIAFVLLIIGIGYTYRTRVVGYAYNEKKLISVQTDLQGEKMKNGSIVEQTFETTEHLKQIKIHFYVEDESKESKDSVVVTLSNQDSDEVLDEWMLSASAITEEIQSFSVEKEKLTDCNRYKIQIKFDGENTYSSIGIYEADSDHYNKGKLVINGEECEGDLGFCVYGGDNRFLNKLFVILTVFLILGGICVAYLVYLRDMKVEKMFLILALILGIGHMCLMPTYSTPDERAHFSTAYYYSNLLMGQDGVDQEGNVLVRNEDLLLNVENIIPDLGTYALMWDNLFEKCQDDTMVSYGIEPLNVPFWSYFPQTLGITIARVFHMGNISLLLLTDLFALIFYAFCLYAAIKYIPFGKMTLLTIGLLPMGLETASSFSYDVLVNGLSLFFIGYVFYLAYDKQRAEKKEWIILAVIMTIMAPVKVVYVLLAFLCLLIPKQGSKCYLFGISGTVISGFLMCVLFKMSTMLSLATSNTSGWAVEDTYTLSYIFTHIGHVGLVLYNTLRDMTDPILYPLFGQRLGFWDIEIPYYIYFGFIFTVLISTLCVENEKQYIKDWQKTLMLVLSLGMIGGITLAMMLDFTSINDSVVRGIQGRYFIPFLPLIMFLLRNNKIVLKKDISKHIIMSMYMLNYFTLWRIFEVVVAR